MIPVSLSVSYSLELDWFLPGASLPVALFPCLEQELPFPSEIADGLFVSIVTSGHPLAMALAVLQLVGL